MLDEDEVNQVLALSSDALLRSSTVSDDLRSTLFDIVTSDSRDLVGAGSIQRQAFPESRSPQYFLLLYKQPVHPRFPAMYIPTFSTMSTPAVVLMAMMLAGSYHSASNGDRSCRQHLDRCRRFLTSTREKDLKKVSMCGIQSRSMTDFVFS
jgi:hypothetical protein